MHGLALPVWWSHDDWADARDLLQQSTRLSTHLFLERLIMGQRADVVMHMILPTAFGLMHDKARNEAVRIACRSVRHERRQVLQRQEQHMLACVKCGERVERDEWLPYQMAMRIMLAAVDGASSSRCVYDVLLCLLCRRCASLPPHRLLVTHEARYVNLCDGLERYVFNEVETTDEDENVAVPYVRRFMQFCHTQDMVAACVRHALCCRVCGDCRRVAPCEGCRCVYFCIGSDCRRAAPRLLLHTAAMCQSLKENGLFLIDEAGFVNDDGAVQYASPPSAS
jgi:hypothetical protein